MPAAVSIIYLIVCSSSARPTTRHLGRTPGQEGLAWRAAAAMVAAAMVAAAALWSTAVRYAARKATRRHLPTERRSQRGKTKNALTNMS